MTVNIAKSKVLIGCLCAFGCQCIFGLSAMFTKQATGQVTPLSLLGWRFAVAFLGLNLCVLLRIIKVDFKGKRLAPVLAIALLNPVIYFIGETVGIQKTTASECGALLSCIPIASLAASTIFLKKRPNRWQIMGIAVASVGVLLTVFAAGLEASFSLPGYAMLLLAVLAAAVQGVLVEKAEGFTGTEITYVMMGMGCLAFTGTALLNALAKNTLPELIALPATTGGFLTAIIYLGFISSILAFIFSTKSIQLIGMNRVATFAGVNTVVSILAGVLFLKESFSTAQMAGVALILAGVYVANLHQDQPEEPEPSTGT